MYFVANWKMFGGLNSINSLNKVIKFYRSFKNNKFAKIIYCPPSTLIKSAHNKLKNSRIIVGAQNCHESESYGAFTGYVNSSMLKSVGAKYVIIGHSENRRTGDTNKIINLKIKSSLKFGLKIIFCIGETLKEKRKKITKKVLDKQIRLGLKKIKIRNKNNILIAYEPVWSIGTGVIPKTDELFDTIDFIKKKFRKYKVLYGGSVNSKNIQELKLINNIDGFLIGGSSQNPNKFIDIIKKSYN